MSLIARLQENIVSRGLGGVESPPETPSNCEIVTINLEQVVTTEKEFYPTTGTYAGVSGWKWNKTIAQGLSSIRTRIESSVGGYSENLEEGSIANDWFGGVLSGLKLLEIKEHQEITKRVGWTPVVEKGVYSIFHKNKALLSKASICKCLTSDFVLPEDVLNNSVQLTVFKRDNNLNNIPYVQYKFNESLVEKYSYFLDDSNKIILSEFFEKKVGSAIAELDSITCHSEFKGYGRRDRSLVYSNYFPFKDLTVFTVENNVLHEWTEVTSFHNSEASDRHFIADKERGIISFSKYVSDENLYVKKDNGSNIEFFNNISALKDKGVLIFNNQEIEYFSKATYKVYCSSTRIASFNTGDAFKVKQQGKFLSENSSIYINYTAVPRLDYEIIEENFVDKNINLKPYKKMNSNGILEISIEERNVNNIILSCDKPNIIDNIFGELFVQADATKVSAEVLNSNGKPVNEIIVNFEAREGNFEGIKPSISKVSNLSGLCHTSYEYEYTDDSLQRFANPNYILGNSYFEVNDLPPGVLAEDIVIFQALKIDPFYGSMGNKYTVVSTDVNNNYIVLNLEEEIQDIEEYKTLYTREFAREDISGVDRRENINPSLCLSNYYNYGLAVINYGGSIKRSGIIREINKNSVTIEGPEEFLLPDSVSLFKRSEMQFKDSGRTQDRILYSYSNQSQEFAPIKASRIVGDRIYFDNMLLPKGSLVDDNKIIAGYKLFFPELVTLEANAINPADGSFIVSNQIKIKVNFPGYLKGLNGFKFIESDNDEGSALGGANFLTVNPEIPNVLNIIVE